MMSHFCKKSCRQSITIQNVCCSLKKKQVVDINIVEEG
jgi:hypothetical protein